VAFADGLILMIRTDSISEAENIANIDMGKIAMWAKNKTKFNEEKSKVMLMTRKRKEQKILVYINNKAIPQVQKLKYLGIIFDKLLFRENLNYIVDKCKKRIFQAAKLNWGLSHKALQTIYLGGIQPLLLYGAPVWIKAIRKENYN